jgi:chromate transporter
MAEDRMDELYCGSALEVLLVFLRLGCTSFGGPIAHLGYFQRELVGRRRWCDEETLAQLIALAQSLPGPSSSQVGFALGMIRAGWKGGLAAWTGFTLPSAMLMLAFAYGHALLGAGGGLLHGLQLVAVAVVAQAVMTMQRSLAPDRLRGCIAVLSVGVTLFVPAHVSTLLAIAGGAAAGLWLFGRESPAVGRQFLLSLPKAAGLTAAAVFLALLAVPPLLQRSLSGGALPVFNAFYRSGALVFGGGHVVLPLLESAVVRPGWVSQPVFLAGYGAVQAMPGPLFSFGVYLGAVVHPTPSPLAYGLLGLFALFLPGLLAMTAVLPFWGEIRGNRFAAAALKGVNASVVGVLIAALYRPLWTSTVESALDFWMALAAFALLTLWKTPAWAVVAGVGGFFLIRGMI